MADDDNDDGGSGGYMPPALSPTPSTPSATGGGLTDGSKSPPPPPTPIEEFKSPPAARPQQQSQSAPMIVSANDSGGSEEKAPMTDNNNTNNNVGEEKEEEAPSPPPTDTAPTTATANSEGGLFAGLSLSSPSTNNNTTNNSESTAADNNSNGNAAGGGGPPSRASTPVHSNASPGQQKQQLQSTTPTTKVNSSPLVIRPTATMATSAGSNSVPPIPPLTTASTNKQIATTTAATSQQQSQQGSSNTKLIISPLTSSTKIHHPDTALRLLRKFYTKSSPYIPQSAGGSQPSSWYGWVFGTSAETAGNIDVDLVAYKEFVDALDIVHDNTTTDGGVSTTTEDVEENEDNTVIVESILGHKGNSHSKARSSICTYITLLNTWCTSSAESAALIHELENEGKSTAGIVNTKVVTFELLSMAIDIGSALVAHGCFDDLYVRLGGPGLEEEEEGVKVSLDLSEKSDEEEEQKVIVEEKSPHGEQEEEEVGAPSLIKKAINMLVESICVADLSSECTELSALKFLLTTGCRMAAVTTTPSNGGGGGQPQPPPQPSSTMEEPMLRGSHLLQTIRVCSQIYLHTEVESNKTTAKAALQQLVITVFVRLERSIERSKLEERIGGMASSSSSSHLGVDEKSDKAAASSAANSNRKRANSAGSTMQQITFPTQDHRDAYLVLRSLCKLSMQSSMVRVVPPPQGVVMNGSATTMGSSEGTSSAAAGSSDAAATSEGGGPLTTATPLPPPQPTIVQDGSIYDPALESRILALQLLLHILRHSSSSCLLHAGPQFQYAIRQYLCTSLLKNTTSSDTNMVELSLRLFVPLIHNYRSLLKTEIEAFVTNVFFVILDSKNSTVQHKLLVVTLFEEICSDATTLAEIFLNYDCDLSAVDLFSRIVNALGKVARVGLGDATGTMSGGIGEFVAGAGAVRAEMTRLDHRELRLAAMKAMRQVLASLHSSIVTPVNGKKGNNGDISLDEASLQLKSLSVNGDHNKKSSVDEAAVDAEAVEDAVDGGDSGTAKKTLVEMYDSKKKRRAEESQAALKFNQKPVNGLKYAAECGHLDDTDPVDVARYLLQNKDLLEKAQIGEYLGREKEWKDGFALKVLRAYGDALDFKSMAFDEAIRYYLSGFRLPGEAQKIDRIMEVFAARYTDQNPSVFPTADSAFILAFSIIMLNTDLHNPAIKEDRKMTIASFQRMNSGVCDGGDFPDEMLAEIFARIKNDPISLKEDDDARESAGIGKGGNSASSSALSTASDFFFGSHYVEQDKSRELNYQKESDQIVRDTESMLRRRRKATKQQGASSGSSSKKTLRDSLKKHASVKFVGTADSGLRDEYVTPMFDVAWGPALAVFSTAIESANGTDGILASIATDEEMDHAVDNAALAIEVSLNGFQLAICIAGLCGNNTARDAYVRALYHFTLLGSSHLLADRHIQCVQSLLRLGRDDGELLGVTWEHIFRALTEIYRLHQVWEGMARNERKEIKAKERAARKAEREAAAPSEDSQSDDTSDEDTSSETSDYNDVHLEEEMDKRMIDEANAMFVHDTIPLDLVDSIFQRSTILSRRSLKDFVYQLCRVSRMEISGYGGHVGSNANDIDLTNDHYMKHHTLVSDNKQEASGGTGVGSTQPAIYSLEKLVEVTHFNMESRPRLIFADIWGTISMHLTSTALHEEAAVALYAVDALRQLSLQFLNREELGVFEFQRRFLKSLETIMSRSTHVSVKELLLSSVEQLISIYGFGDRNDESNNHQGTLRSGWRSVLVVLGTAGLDKNDAIALQGFKLLSDQIDQCMSVCNRGDAGGDEKQPDSLLSEYFVDLVNTLLLFISGPRQDLSSKAIDRLVQLSDVLAEGKVPLSSTRRKAPVSPALPSTGAVESSGNDELELWWPMLLGLSQTMGDPRPEVRVKGLGTLFNIINKHFVPNSSGTKMSADNHSSPRHGDLQTLQLIFRGILVPALEFEEIDGNSTSGFAPELLPPKFVHFITAPGSPDGDAASGAGPEWINTTFEHLMDGCVSICLKSLEAFNSDSLVEEVLAMLNSCLLSDSGHLAVKGLRRLQQFVSNDMELKDITDDTWATVSHMLFRVLSIRGLPPSSVPEVEGATEEQKEELKQDHIEAMNEFIREQKFFSNRRYIGCNAAMVIGSLLTNESIVESMGIHWYVFLTTGLGKGIRDWERAANIMDSKTARPDAKPSPPHYLENVLYARKWMTKFLISLLTQRDVATLETAPCQHVLKEETDSLLRAFLAKESNESSSAIEMRNISKMASDILECFDSLSDDKVSVMKWLSPLLSVCIQTNDTSLRTSVQILLTRLLKEANQNNGNAAVDSS